MDEIIALLKTGRRRLTEGGWIQGAFEAGGKYCSLGSIRAVPHVFLNARTGEFAVYWAARNALHATLEKRDQLPAHDDLGFGGSVAWWNDRPERTKEEVIQLFDETIERLERGSAD
ncbi:DUF6197 family protein [Herbidospora cretacea]|uniref:DUF6197 family protein n=1 Tax=Herbidospora cretacea TaxID=28444 RepID=UPI0007732D8E|nr:hypothetical protein [Herbidospora cretacea]